MAVRREVMAPNGFLHAASVVALADTSCGYGCVAHLPQGASGFTTIELKATSSARRARARSRCRATPVHLGRTTQVWDAVVTLEGTRNEASRSSAAPRWCCGPSRSCGSMAAMTHRSSFESSFGFFFYFPCPLAEGTG